MDAYCGRCGAPQPLAGAHARTGEGLSGISPKTASILCYVPWVGWIAAIVVLSSDRFRHDRDIRFHAFQGLYLFVAGLLNQYVLREFWQWPFGHVGIYGLVAMVLLGAAIFMMVKAAHEEAYALPIIGELAAKSVAED